MAGSDKLYLEPVLSDLLAGLQQTMGSIDGIVDDLGEAVADMKTAVDGVSTTLNTVKNTLTTTNTKLDTVNSSVGETAELGIFPAEITGKTPVVTINNTCWTDDIHRYEYSDASHRIVKFEAFADGAFLITVVMNGDGGLNPGIGWKDLTTGISTNLIANAKATGNTDPQTVSVSVQKGHSYELIADWSKGGSTDNDLIVRTLSYSGYIYKIGAVTSNTLNVEIPE